MAVDVGALRVRITSDLAQFKKGMDEVQGRLGKLSERLSPVVDAAKKTALAVTAIGAAVGGAVAVTGIQFNAMKQQALVAFETMLGSGERAQAFLQDLQRFAAATPFEFPELVQASQKLLAFGFSAEQVLPLLTSIGDAVAGLGLGAAGIDQVTRALGQMQAKGKASAEEMLQLSEAGIPAWRYLAEAIGTDVAGAMDLVRKGAVDSETVIRAVIGGMNRDFGGLMEKQSRTWNGLLSTIKDTFQQLSGTVMAPFFERATEGLTKVADLLGSEGVQRAAETLAARIESGLGAIGGLITEHRGTIEAFLDGLRDGLTTLRDALAGLPWQTWAVGAGLLAAALVALVLPVGLIGAAVAALAVGVIYLIGRWDELSARFPVLGRLTTWLQEQFATLASWVQTDLIPAFQNIVSAIGAVVGFVVEHWPQIEAVVRPVMDQVLLIVTTAFGVIKNLIALAMDVIQGDWSGAWSNIQDILKLAVGFILGSIGNLKDLALAALGLLADLAIGAFQRLLDGAVGKLGDLLAWVSGLPGRVLGALGDLAGSLWSAGLDAGKALINGLVEGIKAISIPVPRIDVGMGETFGVPHPTVDIGVDWRSIGSIIGAQFGALITEPTLALVGENPATAPEIISPVETMRRVVREELARSGRPGQAVTVNQTIQGVQPGDVERETLRALRRAALQWSLS